MKTVDVSAWLTGVVPLSSWVVVAGLFELVVSWLSDGVGVAFVLVVVG